MSHKKRGEERKREWPIDSGEKREWNTSRAN
jgi:hypothetical protein